MRGYIFAGVALLSGCTYNAVAVGSGVAAAEIRADRVRDMSAGLVMNVSDAQTNIRARKRNYSCSAHNYPIDIGPAIRQTAGRVFESSFTSYYSQQANQSSERDILFTFTLDEFDPVVSYSAGFWTGTALADVTIVMRVVANRSNGSEILRTSISGDGRGEADGGCDKLAEALGEAGQAAVTELFENFVYKVINSDQLDM